MICRSQVLTDYQRWDLVKVSVGQLLLGSVCSGSGSEQVFLWFAFDNSLQHIGIVRKKSYIVKRNSKCDKRYQMVALIVLELVLVIFMVVEILMAVLMVVLVVVVE